MTWMNKEDLKKLDLEKHEIDIYWKLLNEGKMSVYKLAKELNVPRSTMYGYTATLVSRGYLTWSSVKKGKKSIEAVNPQNISRIYELEKKKIEGYQDTLQDLLQYTKIKKNNSLAMDIRYYEGVSGLEQIVWNTLSCKSGNMYGISDWDRNYYLPKDFVDLHQKEVWIRGPKDHIITKEGRVHDIKKHVENYPLEIRTLPTEKLFFNGDTYIYDNIFAATIFRDGNIFGFEIENEEFAKIQLSSFMLLWELADLVKE